MDNKITEEIKSALPSDESNNNESVTVHRSHSHHSHSSRHHSHSHRHKSSRKNRNKREKAKRFWKRYKYIIINVISGVLLFVSIILLGIMSDKMHNYNNSDSLVKNTEDTLETQNSIILEVPVFDEEIVIVSPAVTKYMSSDSGVSAVSIYNDYKALGRLDKGTSVNIGYSVNGIPKGYSVRSAEIIVSESKKFESSLVFPVNGEETSVDIFNLKTGTQYYYKIVLSLSNGTKSSVEGSFKTAESPRFLNIDGVCNLRDIGGYKTFSGKKIRQGLLYRSAELDGASDSQYTISSDGISTMIDSLGIKTDMDLRFDSENSVGKNILGAGVRHKYYGMAMYSDVFTDNGKAVIKKIFIDLANRDNYPVILHCAHGMDRTGTVCYLLEALLGMSEEDMMKEYQLSALYHGSLWGLNQFNEFIGMLKSYSGATINEKAETYLLSAGVTEEEIKSIKDIFLS